jgi:hypothetical protein
MSHHHTSIEVEHSFNIHDNSQSNSQSLSVGDPQVVAQQNVQVIGNFDPVYQSVSIFNGSHHQDMIS